MTRLLIPLVLLLTLVVWLPALGGSLEDIKEGDAAYRQGDYATALKKWMPLAERGNFIAQFNVGTMYQNGHGVTKDTETAFKWYKKSAEKGYSYAQSEVALMYFTGMGVPQDKKEGFRWIKLAAEQGNGIAQVNLGRAYAIGYGTPLDFFYGYMWWTVAALRGFEDGKRYLEMNKKTFPPADMAHAQRLARECIEKSFKSCSSR